MAFLSRFVDTKGKDQLLASDTVILDGGEVRLGFKMADESLFEQKFTSCGPVEIRRLRSGYADVVKAS